MALRDYWRLSRKYYQLGGFRLLFNGVYTKLNPGPSAPLEEVDEPLDINLNGQRYQVVGGYSVDKWRQFERGVIMPEVKRPMRDLLTRGASFLDIGSAMGDTALYAHSIIGHDGEIHALEPDVGLFETMVDIIEMNSIDNITVNNLAVGEQSGNIDPTSVLGQTRAQFADQVRDMDTIETITLDEFVSGSGFAPDLIKIDIDGAELRALRGAKESVLGRCPILLELHDSSLLDEREEAIEFIFSETNKIRFLGYQGTVSSKRHSYWDVLESPDDLNEDTVTNILIQKWAE